MMIMLLASVIVIVIVIVMTVAVVLRGALLGNVRITMRVECMYMGIYVDLRF